MSDKVRTRRAAPSCFACQSRETSEWCTVKADDLRALDQSKVDRDYVAGQAIFHQGEACDGLYCIESGTIAVRKVDEQGNMVLVRLCTSGETLGYRTFFAGGHYGAMAEAVESSRLCFIPRATVEALLERNPALTLRFTRRMAQELELSDEQRMQASLSVRVRICHLILALKERFGRRLNDGSWSVNVPLSRQDMAEMVGSRSETITRTLTRLEAEGLVTINRREILIPALDPLLDAAELSGP
jgi:CRP-like cAMP-binding protein